MPYKDKVVEKEHARKRQFDKYHRDIEAARRYRRDWNYKKNHGISLDEVEAMEANQNGCAICGGPPVGRRNQYHLDHCHETGKVRELLCHHCNLLLGNAKDNPDVLRNAVEYLEKHARSTV